MKVAVPLALCAGALLALTGCGDKVKRSGPVLKTKESVFSPHQVRSAFLAHGIRLREEPRPPISARHGNFKKWPLATYDSAAAGHSFGVDVYQGVAAALGCPFIIIVLGPEGEHPQGTVVKVRRRNVCVTYDSGRVLIRRKIMAALASLTRTRSSRVRPQELQACVERWNWMNYRGYFADGVAPAKVQAKPCRVEIAYALPRSDSLYRVYLRTIYFPCTVNRLGAFVCPEHAYGTPTGPPRRGHNARYFPRTGRVQLDHPPARSLAVPKPEWIRGYPVVAGYIVPFDRHGHFRSGLTLKGKRGGITCHTSPNLRWRSRLYGCGAGLWCFVRSLPLHDRQPLACPEDRGSRIFDRGVLRVL